METASLISVICIGQSIISNSVFQYFFTIIAYIFLNFKRYHPNILR